MNKLKLAAIIGCAVLISGCSMRVADLTLGSTKNVDVNHNHFVEGPRVTGEDTAAVVLFPLGIPTIKEAVDRAIEQDKCAVGLTDVVVTQLNHHFLFGSIGYRIEGTLLIDKEKKGCENWDK